MTRRTLSVAACALLCTGIIVTNAADAVAPVVGQSVTLKVPSSLFESKAGWSLKHTTTISTTQERVAVQDRTDWQVAGFPSLVEATISKVKRKRSQNLTEVVLQPRTGGRLILTFPGRKPEELSPFLGQVVCKGGKDAACAKAYLDEAYRLMAEKMFTGPLADLTEPQQMALVKFAHIAASGTRVGSEEFKDQLYLVVDLGVDPNVYNTLQLDQSQRVAKLVNERLLTIMKAFATPVKETPFIYGLKIELQIPYRSFADQYSVPSYDHLEVFVSSESIKKFAELEITSQELLDGAFVVVNSNRIAVPLAG